MYQLAITRRFIAQHYLIGDDWGPENQKHSHHYKLEVRIEAPELDQHGYLIDIVDLENTLTEVLKHYQEHTLNDLPPFKDLNPSLERFAKVIWESLLSKLELKQEALRITLWENDNDWAAYHAG